VLLYVTLVVQMALIFSGTSVDMTTDFCCICSIYYLFQLVKTAEFQVFYKIIISWVKLVLHLFHNSLHCITGTFYHMLAVPCPIKGALSIGFSKKYWIIQAVQANKLPSQFHPICLKCFNVVGSKGICQNLRCRHLSNYQISGQYLLRQC